MTKCCVASVAFLAHQINGLDGHSFHQLKLQEKMYGSFALISLESPQSLTPTKNAFIQTQWQWMSRKIDKNNTESIFGSKSPFIYIFSGLLEHLIDNFII